MPTGTRTSFGQVRSVEPVENLCLVHRHDGSKLVETDFEPKLAVLDQEDLLAQGIDTSALVRGAPKVDALGSCTANATTVGVSNLGLSVYQAYLAAVGIHNTNGQSAEVVFADVKSGEEGAICFYHDESPWPAFGDNGSTGPKIVSTLQKLGIVKSQLLAHTAEDICSLLQTDGVLQGGPFLNAWMEPPSSAIVDGNGSASSLEAQIAKGIAGGHETYISGIAKLILSATGAVETDKTILKVRNSWSKSWGDNGSFLVHLSSLMAMARYYDFRQLVA